MVAKILQNKNQVKTTPKKTNFFQIYPNKETAFQVNANFYHNTLQPLFYLAFIYKDFVAFFDHDMTIRYPDIS